MGTNLGFRNSGWHTDWQAGKRGERYARRPSARPETGGRPFSVLQPRYLRAFAGRSNRGRDRGRRRGVSSVSESIRAMLHRSPVGPERNGPLSLPSSRSRWMSLLRAECQAAKLSNFWVTREIIEEKERKTHRSRAQRHVQCVLPPLLHPCALSLECQPCHRFAFRNCLLPPSAFPECTERILSQRAVR